jgi:hypothetical protein
MKSMTPHGITGLERVKTKECKLNTFWAYIHLFVLKKLPEDGTLVPKHVAI